MPDRQAEYLDIASRTKAMGALVGSIVLMCALAWASVFDSEGSAVWFVLAVLTAGQVLTVAPMVARGNRRTITWLARYLRIPAMAWCVLSAIVVSLGIWSRFRNHGFLGLQRDGYWELETTAAYGVTVWDLVGTLLLVSTQVLTFCVLLQSGRPSKTN